MINNVLATVFIISIFISTGFVIKAGINKCEPYKGIQEYRQCLGI